jgi:hypothetical protein
MFANVFASIFCYPGIILLINNKTYNTQIKEIINKNTQNFLLYFLEIFNFQGINIYFLVYLSIIIMDQGMILADSIKNRDKI